MCEVNSVRAIRPLMPRKIDAEAELTLVLVRIDVGTICNENDRISASAHPRPSSTFTPDV